MGTYLRRILLQNLLQRVGFTQSAKFASVTKTVIFKPRDKQDEIVEDLQTGRKIAIDKLEQLLEIRKFSAMDLVLKTKKLWTISGNQMSKNFETCQKFGVTRTTCIKYPEILAQNDLEYKFELLKILPYDINEKAILVTLNLEEIQRMVSTEMKNGMMELRIKLFIKKLKTTPEVIYESLAKRPFLRNIALRRFEDNVDILTKNGISTEEIIRDWWVLQYSPKTVQDRIDQAKANNIEKIKTWMVRGQMDIFEHYIKRRSENKLILGDNTVAEYLSEKLDCTLEEAKSMTLKLPALKHKSMKKMQEIIDFLYTQGFKPYHIYRVPKILLHSVQTTSKRIKEMEKQGMKMDSLHMLTKSQKQYMQYYEALVKSNKKKIKEQGKKQSVK